MKMSEPISLLHLSDETLINIFKFLDATDLYHLSFVCERLNTLVQDEFLWVWCEARCRPNTRSKVDYCMGNITGKSRAVLLAGSTDSIDILSSKNLFKLTTLEMLTVLAIENIYFNGSFVPLIRFPSQLQEISLSGSYVTHYGDFFRMCSTKLVNLKVMCLERCRWFDSHTLVPLSKLPALEILSLYLCKQLTDEDMSYISLAGRHGFKSLKILDLRFTGYGDEIIRSFFQNQNITEIYFQSYSRTYRLDCANWKLRQLRGELAPHPWNPDGMADVDDTVTMEVRNKFGGEFNINSCSLQKVTDNGVRSYSYTESTPILDYTPPESILYQRPYGKCKCGFMESNHLVQESHTVNTSDEEALQALITHLTHRKITPMTYFLEPRPDCSWVGTREPTNQQEISILEQLSPLHITLLNNRYPSPMGDIIEVSLNRTLDVMLGRPPSDYRIQSLQRHAPRPERPANQNEDHSCVLQDKMRADLFRFCDNFRNVPSRLVPSSSRNETPPKKRKLSEPSTSKIKLPEDSPPSKRRKMNDENSPGCSKESDEDYFGIFTDCADNPRKQEETHNDTMSLDDCVEVVEVVTTIIKDDEEEEDDTPESSLKLKDSQKYKGECSVQKAENEEQVGRNQDIDELNEKKQYEEEDEDMVVVVLQLQEEDQKQLEENFKNVENRQHEGRTTTFFENCSKQLECLNGNDEIKVCVILGQINSPKNNSEETEGDKREEVPEDKVNSENSSESEDEDNSEGEDIEEGKLSSEDVNKEDEDQVSSECSTSGTEDEGESECEDNNERDIKSEDHQMEEGFPPFDGLEVEEKCLETEAEEGIKIISNDGIFENSISMEASTSYSESKGKNNQENCKTNEDVEVVIKENCVTREEICDKSENGDVGESVNAEKQSEHEMDHRDFKSKENHEESESVFERNQKFEDKRTSKCEQENAEKHGEGDESSIEENCVRNEEIEDFSNSAAKGCGKRKEDVNETKCNVENKAANEEKINDTVARSREPKTIKEELEEIVSTADKKENNENISNMDQVSREEKNEEEAEKEDKVRKKRKVEENEENFEEKKTDNRTAEEIASSKDNNEEIASSKDNEEIASSKDKNEEIASSKDNNEEIASSKDNNEEIASSKDNNEEIVSSKDNNEEIASSKDNNEEIASSKDKNEEIASNVQKKEDIENVNKTENGVSSEDKTCRKRKVEEIESADEESRESKTNEDKTRETMSNGRNKDDYERSNKHVPTRNEENGEQKSKSAQPRKRPRARSSSPSSSSSSSDQAEHAANYDHLIQEIEMVLREPKVEPTSLRYISLRGYKKVTDESLRHLQHLQLDLVDVTYTGVTVGGVRRFIELNPHCRVVHESACKCGPRMHF